jgi:hypothetical protein
VVIGGRGSLGPSASIELLESGSFRILDVFLDSERTQHTASVLASGQVLIAGGFGSDGQALSSTEVFDVETESIRAGPDMQDARGDHSATVLSDGRVLVVGGRGDDGALRTVEVFDPETEMFTDTGFLTGPRYGHRAVLDDEGGLLAIGGFDHEAQPSGVVERYDAAAGTFSETASLVSERAWHAAATLGEGARAEDGTSPVTTSEIDRHGE